MISHKDKIQSKLARQMEEKKWNWFRWTDSEDLKTEQEIGTVTGLEAD